MTDLGQEKLKELRVARLKRAASNVVNGVSERLFPTKETVGTVLQKESVLPVWGTLVLAEALSN